MQMIDSLTRKAIPCIIQFVKFSGVGITNTVVGYIVFSFCIFLDWHYLAANLTAFLFGVTNAFFLSRKYVFKQVDSQRRKQVVSFCKTVLAYSFSGIVLSSIMLTILINRYQYPPLIAQLLVLAITTPINFLLNKFWAFKPQKP